MKNVDIEFFDYDEPAVSYEEPGAAEHSSVDRDVMFEPVLSTCRTES